MIKRSLQNLISGAYTARLNHTHSVNIKRKISILKKKDKYRPFPYDIKDLTINNFFALTKNEKLYFDYFYSVNSIADPEYIPLGLYYSLIEPVLNNKMLTAAVKDKNFYQLFMRDIPAPKTILRKINGLYYDRGFNLIVPDERFISELNKNYDKLILKPSTESGGGKSIYLFQKKTRFLISENQKLDTGFLENYKPDFIIQEFVKQHSFFSKFNPTSNNTIRIFIYRSINDDSINILHTLLRIGKEGSYLDHDNLGGVAVSVKKDGSFNEFAYNINGEKCSDYNNINFRKEGEVPFINELNTLSKKIAGRIFYARLLAMDFTIDEKGNPLLLEINCWNNGISQYQMNNGSLFKQFTTEILEYCKNKNSSKKIFII